MAPNLVDGTASFLKNKHNIEGKLMQMQILTGVRNIYSDH